MHAGEGAGGPVQFASRAIVDKGGGEVYPRLRVRCGTRQIAEGRMILSTTFDVQGRQVAQHLGLVRGNVVRSRFIGRDIVAGLRMVIGGEIHEYTKLLAESREQALDRMVAQAQSLGADAVIGIRFETTDAGQGQATEVLAYGTAVKLG